MASRDIRLVPWGALNQAIEDHLATLSVDAFSDVTLTSETTGDVLYYNGTAWVNTAAVTVAPAGAITLKYNGSAALATYTDNTVGVSVNSGAVRLRGWDSSDTDIDGLIGGSASGGLIEGPANAHLVLAVRGNDAGDAFVVLGTDDGDEVYDTLMIQAFPGGPVQLYNIGTMVAQTVSNGLELQEVSTESRLYLGTAGSGALFRWDNGTLFELYGYDHGVPFQIRAETAGGTPATLCVADPDSDFALYYNGGLKFATAGDGAAIYSGDTTTTNSVLRFRDSAGTTKTQFYHSMSTTDFLFQSVTNGGRLRFYAPTTAGTSTQMVVMDPDDSVLINYTGGGLVCGGPTGGNKGQGTINAQAVYDDNVLLTCLPIEEAVGKNSDRAVWDKIFPAGRNTLVDQYEADKAAGFDGTAEGWLQLLEDRGSVPGLPNREEIARRWATTETVRERPGLEPGEIEQQIISVNDKMGVSEISNYQWLALDYMAVALRDVTTRLAALERGRAPV